MKLILNDEFLNQYKIEDKSNYNDNYYRLPFNVDVDNHRFNILHITFNETSDENDYALCYDLVDEDDLFIDELYIAPSYNYGEYEIDLDNYSKDYIWN